MTIKKILLASITLAFVSPILGQQDPQFSHNMFNKMAINPGYAGSNDAICATIIYRNQWVGFDGAPSTGVLTVEGPVAKLRGGLGLTILTDGLGFEKNLGVKLAYAYQLDVGSGKLGIGPEVGILQKSLEGGKLIPIDLGDPTIPVSTVSSSVIDLGIGIYYHTNQLYFGLAASHLPQSPINYTSQVNINLARHYYITAGYDYQMNPAVMLKPSLFIKSDASSTIFDANLLALWNNKFWGGVSYRMGDAIVGMVGMNMPNGLHFGYSYDVTTSAIKGYSSGTHEIMLGYCMKVGGAKPVGTYRNVRFL